MIWAWLCFRRALAPGVVGLCGLWVFLLARVPWTPVRQGGAGALDRHAIWSGACLVLLPLITARAAGAAGRWVRDEADWIVPRPAPRSAVVATAFASAWLAAGVLFAAVALAAERAAGEHTPRTRSLGQVRVAGALLREGERVTRALPVPRAEASALRVRLATLPGGSSPSARVLVHAARPVASTVSVRESSGFGRFAVEVPLPRGSGPVELTLERRGRGPAIALLQDGVEFTSPATGRSAAASSLWLHVWVSAGVWIALATGLGTRLSPSTSWLLLLTLWLPVWESGTGAPWPGAQLPAVLHAAGHGLAPPPFEGQRAAASLAVALVGLALATRGVHRPGGQR